MSTINRLSSVDVLQPGDQIPVWDSSNGDTRKASMSTLLAFVESYFADPDYSTRIVAPAVNYFTVDIGATGDSIWMIVNPTLNFTNGAITLPPATSAVNDQQITVVFTSSVSTFVITSSGATVLGAPTQINGYDSFSVRYNSAQQTWYNIGTTGSGSGAGGVSQIVRQDFTGDGTTTTFALLNIPSALGNELQIFIDGVYQERSGYSVSGVNIIFSEAPPSLSTIEVLGWSVSIGAETTSDLVSYTLGATGSVLTTVQAKLRESVSVKDFGAVGDGVTDDYLAIRAAIDSLPAYGGSVLFPTTPSGGVYRLSQTLIINRPVVLSGDIITASPFLFYTGTVLKFDAGITGIIFNSYDSPGGDLAYGANYCVVENLGVASASLGAGGGAFDGLYIRAPGIVLNNVWTWHFPRDGIHIQADTVDGHSNANLWQATNISTQFNGGNGFYVEGNNANAGLGQRINSSNNGGWGIYDAGQLGDTYIACHVDSNVLGPYKTITANGSHVFLGCYWEPFGPKSDLVTPSIMIGGLASSVGGVEESSTGLVINAAGATNAPITYLNYRNAETIGSSVGKPDTTMAAFTFGANSESVNLNSWKLIFDTTYNVWALEYANSALFTPIRYPNSASALYTNKGSTGPVMQNGYAVMNVGDAVSSAKVRLLNSAAPVTGTFEQGDIVYNNAPTAGGFIGWVCVTGGTPGTWKTFGAISA